MVEKAEEKPKELDKPKHEGKALTQGGVNSLVPRNFAEAERVAMALAKSDIVPKELIGKPANILLVLMFGAEIDLSPAQALQNVMIVNGRPSLWGDAVMGKVEASGLQEAWQDSYDAKVDGGTMTFTTKRKGRVPVTRTFSMEDAKKAGLAGKAGPWTQYPKRMLFHRARSWALRDTYPDVLKGIHYYEEERDVIPLERGEDGGETYYSMPKRTGGETTAAPVAEAQGKAEPPRADPAKAEEPKPQEAAGDAQEGPARADLDAGGYTLQKVKDGGLRVVALDGALYYTENEKVVEFIREAKKSGKGLSIHYWPGIAQNEIEAVGLLEKKA